MKLVLAWVDRTGIELTGRYRDTLRQYPETRSVPEARACMWGDNTPEMLERLQKHVEQASRDHVWTGYFLLENTDDVLSRARNLALASAKTSAHASDYKTGGE